MVAFGKDGIWWKTRREKSTYVSHLLSPQWSSEAKAPTCELFWPIKATRTQAPGSTGWFLDSALSFSSVLSTSGQSSYLQVLSSVFSYLLLFVSLALCAAVKVVSLVFCWWINTSVAFFSRESDCFLWGFIRCSGSKLDYSFTKLCQTEITSLPLLNKDTISENILICSFNSRNSNKICTYVLPFNIQLFSELDLYEVAFKSYTLHFWDCYLCIIRIIGQDLVISLSSEENKIDICCPRIICLETIETYPSN